VVCGIIDTTSEDGSITKKYLNPSGGTRDSNEVAQDPNTESKVGSSANPCATSKLEFRNANLEARKSVSTRGMYGVRLY